jgi:hypothetical protein
MVVWAAVGIANIRLHLARRYAQRVLSMIRALRTVAVACPGLASGDAIIEGARARSSAG